GDAARLGLQDGTLAEITSQTGQGPRSVQAQVQISAEMMPGVVSLPHGWGHNLPGARLKLAAQRPGANLNALLDDQLRDPLSGNAVLGGVAITLQAIPQGA
ncbi:MAG: molybdopterin dinucleotide binding domain-containing protein, partial [Rhodoferax sp.]